MGGGYLLIILILLVVTNGITYGVTSLQSESVSYTRNGETKSVKEALDDLIVKVDKKSGNFNITLSERTIAVNFTESVSTYKSIVDTVLSKMITDMGSDVNSTELSTLKSATLTWKSENTGIASVTSNTTVKGVSTGQTKIIGTAPSGQQVIVPVKVISAVYLADKVTAGDYVAYDAGQWGSSSTVKPTKQGQFGGNAASTNKGMSVACYESSAPTLKGWRVLNVNKDTKTVTIVHAGQPECYFHGLIQDDSVKTLNARAKEQYLNTAYATEAHAMNYREAIELSSSNTLLKTGVYYWLAAANSSTDYGLYYVSNDGSVKYNSTSARGFRPVIVLKSDLLTTGKGKDQFNNDAWIIA